MFSIRQRLTLWYTFVLMIAMIVFAVVIFVGGAWQLQRTTDFELQQTARQLTGAAAARRRAVGGGHLLPSADAGWASRAHRWFADPAHPGEFDGAERDASGSRLDRDGSHITDPGSSIR